MVGLRLNHSDDDVGLRNAVSVDRGDLAAGSANGSILRAGVLCPGAEDSASVDSYVERYPFPWG